MKKIISLVLCAALCLTLCGCTKSLKDIFSNVDKTISDIAEKSPLLNEIGVYITKKLSSGDIKKLTPYEETEVGQFANCYSVLTENQKTIYRYLLAAAEDMPGGWFYCGKETEHYKSDIAIAYRAMLCDNPQIFWMPASYVYATKSGKICLALSLNEDDVTNDYPFGKKERDGKRTALRAALDEITAAAAQKGSDYEKELFVHDYLCKNSVYNLEGSDMIYTSYGALVDKVCVCEGYSRAMQLVMQRLGINCTVVYGVYENVGHMWNQINIAGNWYNLDITWDQSESYGTLHGYFNVTDEEIKTDHIISSPVSNNRDYTSGESFNIYLAECTSNEYNYFYFGNRFVTNSAEQTANAILNEYASGAEFAELLDISDYPVADMLSSAAYILRDRVTLTKYSKLKKQVLVFFENTY